MKARTFYEQAVELIVINHNEYYEFYKKHFPNIGKDIRVRKAKIIQRITK